MKLVILGLLLLLVACSSTTTPAVVCTKDCRGVCDERKVCCYDICVPSSCDGPGRDIRYYTTRGFLQSSPDTGNWPTCSGSIEQALRNR